MCPGLAIEFHRIDLADDHLPDMRMLVVGKPGQYDRRDLEPVVCGYVLAVNTGIIDMIEFHFFKPHLL